MKKNFLKVFSLLLVLSMLAISVSAVVTDKPQSEITITAEPGTVVLCKSATVTVTLTMPTCYAIEGQWTATSGLTLTSLTRDGGATLSHTNGVVEWADVEGTDETKWFTNPMKTMTATYTATEAGTYTVDFTCTVFAGGKQITAGDIEVWEGTFKYSVDIQVVEHDYSAEWTQGESTHWHACSCGAKTEEAAHADTATKDHKCDTCGYVMGECADSDDADHNCDHCGKENITDHVYGTEWKSDETNHWHECACGAKSEEAAHSDETTKDHKCDTCGYVMGECADSDDADHNCDHCGKENITDHIYGTEWKTDETNHWHACSCGAKSEEAAHADTATKDHKCDTCGYVMSECADGDDADHNCDHCGAENITDHVYGTEWKNDATNHWRECACGAKTEEAAHADTATKDHKCDTCGYVMSECADGDDADHNCDHCGVEGVTEHSYEWKSNDEKHWRECACGAKSDEGDHDFTNGDCVCGAEKPVTDVVVTAKGTISHTVEGQVVTVTHSVACKVGYWDEAEGKYIAITAVANGDGSYSFTAPEGVTEVLLVVKGDVTGDGNVNAADTGKLNASLIGRGSLTAATTFAADVTNDGKVNAADTGKLNSSLTGRSVMIW